MDEEDWPADIVQQAVSELMSLEIIANPITGKIPVVMTTRLDAAQVVRDGIIIGYARYILLERHRGAEGVSGEMAQLVLHAEVLDGCAMDILYNMGEFGIRDRESGKEFENLMLMPAPGMLLCHGICIIAERVKFVTLLDARPKRPPDPWRMAESIQEAVETLKTSAGDPASAKALKILENVLK